MEGVTFKVQGSGIEPYEVKFLRSSKSGLSAYCSCPAGENGMTCKHRLSILDGNQENIVSSNGADVKIVQSWLFGTDIEKILLKMRHLEAEVEKVKNELSSTKKALAKAMRA
ncbi:SWIM zinc finger domain-containing protein [Methylotenera sp.]|uniref:SWIM zinc finger family protein n=1 Tax=Methylotenera sp. TaxID=2051956 RepID=UPI00248A8B97|nr:SWIM zinc finger family protein [Methylotenera sp.]MDI1300139.1 SWIM zinc finger family protein [Methylotenera sp.]